MGALRAGAERRWAGQQTTLQGRVCFSVRLVRPSPRVWRGFQWSQWTVAQLREFCRVTNTSDKPATTEQHPTPYIVIFTQNSFKADTAQLCSLDAWNSNLRKRRPREPRCMEPPWEFSHERVTSVIATLPGPVSHHTKRAGGARDVRKGKGRTRQPDSRRLRKRFHVVIF